MRMSCQLRSPSAKKIERPSRVHASIGPPPKMSRGAAWMRAHLAAFHADQRQPAFPVAFVRYAARQHKRTAIGAQRHVVDEASGLADRPRLRHGIT